MIQVGKREDNAIATRQKLISTANRLIVDHGYEDVSVDDIVKASGIAKGTFYNYFERKEDLIFELSKIRFAPVAKQSEDLVGRDSTEIIKDYLVDFMTVIVNSKIELARQWVRYVSASDANQGKFKFDVQSFEDLLMKLIDLEVLKVNTPVHQIAQLFLTEMYGVILTWCVAPSTVAPIATVKRFCDLQLPKLLEDYVVWKWIGFSFNWWFIDFDEKPLLIGGIFNIKIWLSVIKIVNKEFNNAKHKKIFN